MNNSASSILHKLLPPLLIIFSSQLWATEPNHDSEKTSHAPTSITFSNIVTAQSAGSQEALVVGGGSWFTQRKLTHSAVLVKHPKGSFLWDSGIGTDIEAQMEVFNFIDQQLFKIENVSPAVNQLQNNNFDPTSLMAIIPSHMHWDHVSGLEDFNGIDVWVKEAEHQAALAGKPPAFVHSQFDSEAIKWRYIELDDKPYRGFKSSLDIFKDGSAVLVDLFGHTAGQLGLFLNTDKGEFFFIGDTTWAIEGIYRNIGRPKILNWAMGIDVDVDKNDQLIDNIHQLHKTHPDLTIVPAHDENITATLPRYPNFL